MAQVVGPCNGIIRQFYYDRRSDSCQEFEYSGCQGNKNRFQDRGSCEAKCRKGSEVDAFTEEPQSATEIVPSSPICSSAVDAGPCNQEVTAYYFNTESRTCQAFIYGGCEGNANRFLTEEQCERLCGRFQQQGIYYSL